MNELFSLTNSTGGSNCGDVLVRVWLDLISVSLPGDGSAQKTVWDTASGTPSDRNKPKKGLESHHCSQMSPSKMHLFNKTKSGGWKFVFKSQIQHKEKNKKINGDEIRT